MQREVEIEATPQQVWDALATHEGRDRWLEDKPDREIHVEVADEPRRLVWWWWTPEDPVRRVEFLVAAAPLGTRVVVIETEPSFPLTLFAGTFASVMA